MWQVKREVKVQWRNQTVEQGLQPASKVIYPIGREGGRTIEKSPEEQQGRLRAAKKLLSDNLGLDRYICSHQVKNLKIHCSFVILTLHQLSPQQPPTLIHFKKECSIPEKTIKLVYCSAQKLMRVTCYLLLINKSPAEGTSNNNECTRILVRLSGRRKSTLFGRPLKEI